VIAKLETLLETDQTFEIRSSGPGPELSAADAETTLPSG